MISVNTSIEIDYGHCLPNHFSFCNQVHGHRAKIWAEVCGDMCKDNGHSSEGMVYDFKHLKASMMENIHGILDHGFAVWEKDDEMLPFITKRNKKILITELPPTAEFLCQWAFKQIASTLPKELTLLKVIWYETPNNYATYSPDRITV